MSMSKFIEELASQGVMLAAEGDQLRIRAPQGALTSVIRDQIAARKAELISELRIRDRRQDTELPRITHDEEHRFDPFPLTDIQHAYWIGRGDLLALGGTAVHAYLEIELNDGDVDRLESSLNRMIERHDMLRMIISADGMQQVLENVPRYTIKVYELEVRSAEELESHILGIRAEMSHQILSTDEWPLFDIRITKHKTGSARLHLSLDILMADLWSLFILFSEWRQVYDDPNSSLPDIPVTFRDYLIAEQQLEASEAYRSAKRYWLDRLDGIFPAPELPLACDPSVIKKPRFVRRSFELDSTAWQKLQKIAASLQITPSGLLLAVFAEVLARWSKSPQFTLNLTLFNRLPLHERINAVVGDFTTTILLTIDNDADERFEDRARRVQKQLYRDLEHREFSGVEVIRELGHRHTGTPSATMPVVFSSALGLGGMDRGGDVDTRLGGQLGEVVYGITQTPQVWIDHQVFERDGALSFNWDVVEALFPDGMIDDMFSAYCRLLSELSEGGQVWGSRTTIELPDNQREMRCIANSTSTEHLPRTITDLVQQATSRDPLACAVVDERRQLSYQELERESCLLAGLLLQCGAEPENLIGVVLDKGWEQAVAVQGILRSGAGYLPIDPNLPERRRQFMLDDGEVRLVVTTTELKEALAWPEDLDLVCIDSLPERHAGEWSGAERSDPDRLAYVIYTSGSTGRPKGVALEHRAVANTLQDMNERYGINSDDSVLAVSSLGFDLSVYDLFGIWAAGGKVVFPSRERQTEPAHWWEMIQTERITVWNTVPALFQMLLDYCESLDSPSLGSLRLVILSGDWIPLDLPGRARKLSSEIEVISQGGATEAAIWSIAFPIKEVHPDWASIPYGKPLRNQFFRVLDENYQDRPDWSVGVLHIGGAGLARGYWRDKERTDSSFVNHPVDGVRLYRTGDLGRYRPDGNIEFLGREDHQVKVNGYRIEIGEIESAMARHPAVKEAVVRAFGARMGGKRLVGYYVPDASSGYIDAIQLKQYLKERLPEYMVPVTLVELKLIPLTANGKVDRNGLLEPKQDASEEQTPCTSPLSPEEKTISDIMAQLLRLDTVGRDDSFFELGGDSLLATRLVTAISKSFGVPMQLRTLFQGPTVAQLAAYVSGAVVSSAPSDHIEAELEENEEEGEI